MYLLSLRLVHQTLEAADGGCGVRGVGCGREDGGVGCGSHSRHAVTRVTCWSFLWVLLLLQSSNI